MAVGYRRSKSKSFKTHFHNSLDPREEIVNNGYDDYVRTGVGLHGEKEDEKKKKR